MDDADSWTLEDPTTTRRWADRGRLATGESDDIRDPNLVAYVDYTLQSIDVGGSAQQGETDDGGEFEGVWRRAVAASAIGRQGRLSVQQHLELTVKRAR